MCRSSRSKLPVMSNRFVQSVWEQYSDARWCLPSCRALVRGAFSFVTLSSLPYDCHSSGDDEYQSAIWNRKSYSRLKSRSFTGHYWPFDLLIWFSQLFFETFFGMTQSRRRVWRVSDSTDHQRLVSLTKEHYSLFLLVAEQRKCPVPQTSQSKISSNRGENNTSEHLLGFYLDIFCISDVIDQNLLVTC